ncbi:MAG: cytidine deaminase [Candidatus Rifleibacteriota bacterium]
MNEKELIKMAKEASLKAYAPYSNFKVGAALELENGEGIPGCNVENASYGLTNCAERTALFAAIAQGHTKFKKIVVYVDREDFTSPCGACRQVINELAPDAEILLVNSLDAIKRTSIQELLPLSFGSEDLKGKA